MHASRSTSTCASSGAGPACFADGGSVRSATLRRRMKHAVLPLLLLVLASCALTACGLGSNSAAPRKDTSDKRAGAMSCFKDKGVAARLQGDNGIVIGSGPQAPHVQFFLTAGESEAASFEGHGEGAEQIGSALLYVGHGSDDLLKNVETCLASL